MSKYHGMAPLPFVNSNGWGYENGEWYWMLSIRTYGGLHLVTYTQIEELAKRGSKQAPYRLQRRGKIITEGQIEKMSKYHDTTPLPFVTHGFGWGYIYFTSGGVGGEGWMVPDNKAYGPTMKIQLQPDPKLPKK